MLNVLKPAETCRINAEKIRKAAKTKEEHSKTHDCFAAVFCIGVFHHGQEITCAKNRNSKGADFKIEPK